MLKVVVDIGSLAAEASGAVAGIIYIETENTRFPEANWWDFPAVILSWWMEAIRLKDHDGTDNDEDDGYEYEENDDIVGGAKLLFMDGPFEIRCLPQEEKIHVVLVDSYGDEHTEVDIIESTWEQLADEVRAAATRVAQHCLKEGLSTAGLDLLLGIGHSPDD
jgi:hypothetical protein